MNETGRDDGRRHRVGLAPNDLAGRRWPEAQRLIWLPTISPGGALQGSGRLRFLLRSPGWPLGDSREILSKGPGSGGSAAAVGAALFFNPVRLGSAPKAAGYLGGVRPCRQQTSTRANSATSGSSIRI